MDIFEKLGFGLTLILVLRISEINKCDKRCVHKVY